jgi:LPXTG-motif cell wall-anchored protein
MDTRRQRRADRSRSTSLVGVALVALLAMMAAASAAFASDHDGVYPPIPEWDDKGNYPVFDDELVCTPEVVAPGGTVTCTASIPAGIEQIEYSYGVHRSLVEGAWDDKDPDWDRRDDEDRDEWDECCDLDFIPVHNGYGIAPVAADGTAVFSFDIVSDARDGDRYAVVAYGKGPGEDCFVVDRETEEIIGRGAFESDDEHGFVVGGVRYAWEGLGFFCPDQYHAWAFGLVTELDEDGEDEGVGNGEEAAPTPAPDATGPAPTLPRTGASTWLLALLGAVALAGGATAIGASRRLARRRRA